MSSTKKFAAAILAFTAIPAAGMALAVPAMAAPNDIIQQVGVPASGNCTDVVEPQANISGVAAGGWGKSWARWIAPATGGFVCTRTLWFNNTTQRWDRR